MTKRLQRSDQELFGASKHLWYEVAQFCDCFRRLRYCNYQETDFPLYCAVLTAFTIYTRNLLDFFYTSPVKDDVVAPEYYDDSNFWKVNAPQKTPVVDQMEKKIDKLSAHLTIVRVTMSETERYWSWKDIYNFICPVVVAFVRTVPSHRLCSELRAWASNPPERII